MSEMMLFTCRFIGVKSDVGVMNSPIYSMRFTPLVSLFCDFLIFVVGCNILLLHRYLLFLLFCFCVG